MGFKHIIPTTGYRACFSGISPEGEQNDLPFTPEDCLIFPVLAFAVRDDAHGGQELCGLILDENGKPVVCEDMKFANFLFYVPPADVPHVTRTVASLIRADRLDDEERWTMHK